MPGVCRAPLIAAKACRFPLQLSLRRVAGQGTCASIGGSDRTGATQLETHRVVSRPAAGSQGRSQRRKCGTSAGRAMPWQGH